MWYAVKHPLCDYMLKYGEGGRALEIPARKIPVKVNSLN
jgi:hypothetical protein